MNTIKKIRFEYRYETALLTELNKLSLKLGISKNQLMKDAIYKAKENFTRGLLHYRKKSDFLHRKNSSDKHRYEIILNQDERDFLRTLAFTWRVSQAEVVRVLVEYYVHSVHGKDPIISKVYLKKVRYTRPVLTPMLVVYDIANVIEAKYHMFHPPTAWNMQIT